MCSRLRCWELEGEDLHPQTIAHFDRVIRTGPAASPAALGTITEPSVQASLLRSEHGPAWLAGMVAGASGVQLLDTAGYRTKEEMVAAQRGLQKAWPQLASVRFDAALCEARHVGILCAHRSERMFLT